MRCRVDPYLQLWGVTDDTGEFEFDGLYGFSLVSEDGFSRFRQGDFEMRLRALPSDKRCRKYDLMVMYSFN